MRLRSDNHPTQVDLATLLSESNETLTRSNSGLNVSRSFFKGLIIGVSISIPMWIGIGYVIYWLFWR